jgi:hypothetical protein
MANVSNLFPISLPLVQIKFPLHMATTSLLLQRPYKSDGTKTLNPDETRLYLFLILDRAHIVKIKTEHVIYPNQWDFSKQLKKDKLAGSLEFNKKLLELKD